MSTPFREIRLKDFFFPLDDIVSYVESEIFTQRDLRLHPTMYLRRRFPITIFLYKYYFGKLRFGYVLFFYKKIKFCFFNLKVNK